MEQKTYRVVEQVEAVPLAYVMALHDILIQLKPEQRIAAIRAAMVFAGIPV